MTTQTTKCRNCGTPCTSRYCPQCGQSTTEKRLKNKTFFIGLVSGLSRINRGFLYTASQLLVHPWTVIRDYINCRRIRYVAPVSMLIVVCFISAFISSLIPAKPDEIVHNFAPDQVPDIFRMLLMATEYLMNSTLARNLIIYIPALMAIPVVYWNAGARKYNLAEYFTAMLYMTSSFVLFGIILSPLAILSEPACSILKTAYTIIISAIALYHAFPVGSYKKRTGYFVLYLLTSFVIYLLIILGIIALSVSGIA